MSLTKHKIESIPLFNLRLSLRNVRTVQGPVDDLVGSIRAHGLLKNLVVIPCEKEDGWEVVAGERRRRALQELVKLGEIDKGELIDCLVLPSDASAEEISLAENVEHEPMNPADEFVAFDKLVKKDHLTSDDIAARFGKSKQYVEQRLKLANVAPSILTKLRNGEIQIGQVMALSITEDHDLQLKVWKAASRDEWSSRPDRIREQIAGKALSVKDSPIAKFLGADDYEKGGGIATRDLFSDNIWLPDPKLARALANEKLQKAVAALPDEGWLWKQTRLELDYNDKAKFSGYGSSYVSENCKKANWPDAAKKVSGMIVTIGRDGELEIYRGLVRPEDAKAAALASKQKDGKGKGSAKVKPEKKPGELSFAQVQRLQGERTAVLRAELAVNPRISLAAFAADLAGELDLVDSGGDRVVRISGERQFTIDKNIREAIDAHPRTKELSALYDQWEKRLKPAKGKVFAWLLEQPESVTHELLAFLAAGTIVAGESFDKKIDRGIQFTTTAGIDMAQHWVATKDWLQAQPKHVVFAAVEEARGKTALAELDHIKGKELIATRAEQLLAGTGWIPKALRAPGQKIAAQKASKVATPSTNASIPAAVPRKKAGAKMPAKKASKRKVA